jgi:hypothetical protein
MVAPSRTSDSSARSGFLSFQLASSLIGRQSKSSSDHLLQVAKASWKGGLKRRVVYFLEKPANKKAQHTTITPRSLSPRLQAQTVAS